MLKKSVVFVAVLTLAACGDSDSKDKQNTGGMSANQAGGMAANQAGGMATATSKLSFFVQNAQTSMGLANAEICVDGQNECLTSDAEGNVKVAMDYAVGVTIKASIKAGGFMTARINGVTIARDANATPLTIPMVAEGVVALLGQNAEGVDSLDDTKGHIAFVAAYANSGGTNGVENVSLSLEPANSAMGPHYTKAGKLVDLIADNPYDPMLKATTNSGAINYFNVTPGQYTATTAGAPDGCNVIFGVPGDNSTIKTDVKAGELTYLSIICPEK